MIRGLLARLNRPAAQFLARLPLRLEAKLIAAFLGLVALLLLLGTAGLALLGETERRTEALIDTQARIAGYRDLEDHGHTLLIAISSALWMPGETVGPLAREIASLEASLAKLKPPPGEETAQVAELRRDYTRFLEIVKREYALLRAGDLDLAGAVQTEQGQPAATRLQRSTGALVAGAEEEAAQEVSAIRRAYRDARNLLIAFIAVAVLSGLYLAHTFSGSVVEPLREIGARLAEIARGGFAGRVSVANRDEIGTLAENVNRTSEQLGGLYADLEAEKERSEAMLYGILPREIVARRRAGEDLVADRVPQATVLFSDMAGFTELSDRLAPEEVVDVLDVLFSRFDAIAGRLGLEKIKTIGDGYMVAGGVLQPRPDHAAAVAEMALAMRAAAEIATRALGVLGQPIRVRIGVHSGPLVAGVLGNYKLVYDVWGDTVNTASRMEKYGEPGRIAVSAATRALLGNQFRFEPRDLIAVKGKGEMETFFLERRIGPQRYGSMMRRLAAARAAA